jgi:cell division protease FtsH
MVFGDLTTGASNDLQVSTALARDMVTLYGMSEKIGPVALESAQGKVLFGMGVSDREYSEKVASEIDSEVTRIMTEGRETAKKCLNDNKKAFEAIAKRLIETETIEREEYESILVAQGIIVKKNESLQNTKIV